MLLSFFTYTGQGLDCGSLANITRSGDEQLVNLTDNPCVQCLAHDGLPRSDTEYDFHNRSTGGTVLVVGDSAPGLVAMDGVLRIFDSSLIADGADGSISLTCTSLGSLLRYRYFEIFSNSRWEITVSAEYYPEHIPFQILLLHMDLCLH